MFIIWLAVVFACWGSFLNVLGFRLVRDQSIVFPNSYCPHCSTPIAWYDNIPIISWLMLSGSCRNCKQAISPLYPLIELFTAASLLFLWYQIPLNYFFAYFIFFSALIVTIRSDLETFLISRFATLFLIPVGIGCAYFELLPITTLESILGALLGYGFLYIISKLFYALRKIEGIGQGDLELLAFIGAFTGIVGCWFTLLISSILGLIIGLSYLLLSKQTISTRIPFGPFLALSAMIFVLFQADIITFFFQF